MELASKIAPAEELVRWVQDSRAFTLKLIEDLSTGQLLGEKVVAVEPMICHVGHICC